MGDGLAKRYWIFKELRPTSMPLWYHIVGTCKYRCLINWYCPHNTLKKYKYHILQVIFIKSPNEVFQDKQAELGYKIN